MIAFVQSACEEVEPYLGFRYGLILEIEVTNNSGEGKQPSVNGKRITKNPGPNIRIMDMETGEMLRDNSHTDAPEWLSNPLIRSLKLAQFKKAQRRKRK